jgi:hypothetical protein
MNLPPATQRADPDLFEISNFQSLLQKAAAGRFRGKCSMPKRANCGNESINTSQFAILNLHFSFCNSFFKSEILRRQVVLGFISHVNYGELK